MKTQTIKIFIVIIVGALASTQLKAQTENTGQSLIRQLQSGTAPGLKFAKNVPAAKIDASENVEKKESLIAQIRKGTAPGLKFMAMSAAGAAAARAATPPAGLPQSGPLASEAAPKKETLRTVAPTMTVPTQVETKNESPVNKQ